jgi:hypothetical protein
VFPATNLTTTMTEQQLDRIVSLLERIAKALESGAFTKPRAAANTSARTQSSGRKEELVEDIVDDTGDWGDVEMAFSKHRGKPLEKLPVGFVGWLGDNWEPNPKYDNSALESCIKAVRDSRAGGPRPVKAGDAGLNPSREGNMDAEVDDVPF